MVQSSASAIVFAVAVMSAASSMALPLEQATGNPDIMNPSAHPSVSSARPSAPSANPSGPSVHSSGSSPAITSAPHMSGSAGGTKTQNGSPNQTITLHRTITLAPHCYGKHGSIMGGGDGKGGGQHPSGTPHPSLSLGVLPPSGSANPSISHILPLGGRAVNPSPSMPPMSGSPGQSVKSGVPSAHQTSVPHQSSVQEPYMTLTAGQSRTTTVISKNGTTGGETVHVLTIVKPTGCPAPGDKPGNKGGHSHGDNHGHGNGTGPNKQGNGGNNGHEENHQKGGNDDHHGKGAGQPKNGQNQNGQGGNNGHQETNSSKATPTQGGNGAGSSGKPDPAQAKGQSKREMIRREYGLDELD